MPTIKISNKRSIEDRQLLESVIHAVFLEPLDATTFGDMMDGFHKTYWVSHPNIPDNVNGICLIFQPENKPDPKIKGMVQFANVDGQNIYYFEDPEFRFEKEYFEKVG